MKSLDLISNLLKHFEDEFGLEVQGAQQGSEAWLDLKLGVISASNVSKAVAKKGSATRETYMCSLIGQVCTGIMPEINGKALDWGKVHEDSARAHYEFLTSTTMTELPFVFKDSSFRAGASPDGLLINKSKGVEIKVPFNTENHIKSVIADKIKPEYVWQVQFSMWVLGCETYDFCSYDPRMNGETLKIMTVEKDTKKHEILDNEIPEFIGEMDKHLNELGIKFGDQWKRKAKKIKDAI